MTPQEGYALVENWVQLLIQIDNVAFDVEMAPEDIRSRLSQRQEAIDGIQQLDAELKKLAQIRENEWKDKSGSKYSEIDALIEKGRGLKAQIRERDAQLIENASKKREWLLGQLKVNRLSKEYLPSQSTLKIRPPAIVDGNA